MENSKFEADYTNEEVEGGRNVPKEEEEQTVNHNVGDNNENECRSFVKIEDTLDDLFSDILKRKSQLHCHVGELREGLIDLIQRKGKVATNLKSKIEVQADALAQYEAENSELKSEIYELKNKISESDSRVCELNKDFENWQQEKKKLLSMLQNSDTGYESIDLKTWVTVTSNEEKDLNSKQKSEIGNKSDETGKLESGKDEPNSKDEKEAERKDSTKELQLTIELLDNWYNFKWTEVYVSLLQEKLLNHSTLNDVMFRTLWQAYIFTRETVSMQLKKISLNFNFLYSSEVAEHNAAELELPEEIVQSLKEFLSKVEPKDMNRTFREKFQKELSEENAEFLNENPKFISYISDCLQLCRQLIFKSKYLHLRTHRIGDSLSKECFNLYSGSEIGVVERVIFPALILYKNNKVVTLRKGLVSTKLAKAGHPL